MWHCLRKSAATPIIVSHPKLSSQLGLRFKGKLPLEWLIGDGIVANTEKCTDLCISIISALQNSSLEARTKNMRALLMIARSRSPKTSSILPIVRATSDIQLGPLHLELGEIALYLETWYYR